MQEFNIQEKASMSFFLIDSDANGYITINDFIKMLKEFFSYLKKLNLLYIRLCILKQMEIKLKKR